MRKIKSIGIILFFLGGAHLIGDAYGFGWSNLTNLIALLIFMGGCILWFSPRKI
jgi:hypothetical protein